MYVHEGAVADWSQGQLTEELQALDRAYDATLAAVDRALPDTVAATDIPADPEYGMPDRRHPTADYHNIAEVGNLPALQDWTEQHRAMLREEYATHTAIADELDVRTGSDAPVNDLLASAGRKRRLRDALLAQHTGIVVDCTPAYGRTIDDAARDHHDVPL